MRKEENKLLSPRELQEQELEQELERELEKQEGSPFNIKEELVRYCLYIVVTVIAAVLVINFAHNAYSFCYIPSESMEPTMMTKDVVVVSHNDLDSIERYDIIVFDAPDNPEMLYTKRVIGLPGETVVVKNGKVLVNGVKTDDSFVNQMWNRDGDGTYEVPEGCYFVMGDNRDSSYDSRFWENTYVTRESIQGKVKCCVYPLNRIQNVIYAKTRG